MSRDAAYVKRTSTSLVVVFEHPDHRHESRRAIPESPEEPRPVWSVGAKGFQFLRGKSVRPNPNNLEAEPYVESEYSNVRSKRLNVKI